MTDVNGVTLSVGTYGEACGWFYKLNGEGNQPAAGTNALADGDVIELFYTDNNEAEGIVTLVGDVNGDGIVTVVDAPLLHLQTVTLTATECFPLRRHLP